LQLKWEKFQGTIKGRNSTQPNAEFKVGQKTYKYLLKFSENLRDSGHVLRPLWDQKNYPTSKTWLHWKKKAPHISSKNDKNKNKCIFSSWRDTFSSGSGSVILLFISSRPKIMCRSTIFFWSWRSGLHKGVFILTFVKRIEVGLSEYHQI